MMETADNAPFHIVQVQGWVQKGDKFLLAQRDSKELQAPGAWSIPGGKVEHEVSRDILQSSLKKELREEVGLEITDDMTLIANDSFIRSDNAPVVSLTFLCQWASGEAQALEETAAVQWLTLEELKTFPDMPVYMHNYVAALEKAIHGA